MKPEPSTASKSLRAVSIAISLVTVTALATLGYSGYEAFAVITTPHSGFQVSSASSFVGTSLVLTVNGTVPNRGLYSIVFDWRYEARAEGVLLGNASLAPVSLPPGKNTSFSEHAVLDFFGTTNATALRTLLLNGSRISIIGNGTFGLGPFVSLTVSNASSLVFTPPMGNFHIGHPSLSVVNGKQQFGLDVTFVDEAGFTFPYGVYAEIYSGQALVANSTAKTGQATPGQTVLLSLLATSNQQVGSGSYLVVIHVLLAGANVPVALAVRI